MSTSCYLELATPAPLATIVDLVAHSDCFRGDPVVIASDLLDDGAVTRWGTVVNVWEQRPEQPEGLVWDYLGIRATADVSFYFGKRRHDDEGVALQGGEQQASIVALTSTLLHALPGDAVLHCDLTDDIWIMRRAGRITVTDNPDAFLDAWLDGFTHPYERQHQEFA